MNGEEFRRALARIGLTVENCGEFLGVTRRHAYRLAAEEYPVPESMAKLLWLMAHCRIKAEDWDEL